MFMDTQNFSVIPNQAEKNYTPPSVPSVIDKHRNKSYSDQNNVVLSSKSNPAKAIVKFHISGRVFATEYKVTTTIGQINESLKEVLDLEEDIIYLEKDNVEVKKSLTLADLDTQNHDKINFQLLSRLDEGKTIILAKINENIPTLDVITVHLGEDGDYKDIVVEIENQCCQKEWLGGYRNNLTQTEYHHAQSQTKPKQRKVFEYGKSGEIVPLLFHRDTQTPFKRKDITVDTHVNKATQMWKSDLYIISKTDKILTARPYLNYDTWCLQNNYLKSILTIQRAFRRWLRDRRRQTLIYLQKTLLKGMKTQTAQILKEQADREQAIITGTVYPVTRDDFYTLYLMVDIWWKKEWKKICDLRCTESKKAESVSLLQKEVSLLEVIEKHRIAGKHEALKKERVRFLEQTSRPITYKNSKGKMISIDDIQTQRARELKEIYSALICKRTRPKDRIEVLIVLKQVFVSHYMNYEYAKDIISLIEREVDLLAIGTKMGDLKGLHKRLEQLYMHFLEQEQFNLKASKYINPNFPKTLHTLFQCTRCLKLLPASKYPVHVRMKAYTECKSCVWLQNIGHQRIDMSPYLKLLRNVQNSEMQKCCYAAVSFILQPIGMSYLTNEIWLGHSAISECRDLSKLQHMRWLPDVEWAPWNTILLTNQEAKCHASIPNVLDFYEKTFIEKVRQRHILARRHFKSGLLKTDHEFRTSGVWTSVTDTGPFLHPSHAKIFHSHNDYDTF